MVKPLINIEKSRLKYKMYKSATQESLIAVCCPAQKKKQCIYSFLKSNKICSFSK